MKWLSVLLLAGLTAAWKLKKAGLNNFVLLELEKETGGTARSGTGEPVPYPWGAHYLPVPFEENIELISLLDEMELTERQLDLILDAAGLIELLGRFRDGKPMHSPHAS